MRLVIMMMVGASLVVMVAALVLVVLVRWRTFLPGDAGADGSDAGAGV